MEPLFTQILTLHDKTATKIVIYIASVNDSLAYNASKPSVSELKTTRLWLSANSGAFMNFTIWFYWFSVVLHGSFL